MGLTGASMTPEVMEKFKNELAEERIKFGVDYTILYKYKQLRILCCEIWQDEIREVAKKHNITIHGFYTFPLSETV
jgi:hypothetical protein